MRGRRAALVLLAVASAVRAAAHDELAPAATAPTTSTTITATTSECPVAPPRPLGRITFTLGEGTATCGPSAVPPLSGRVDDGAGQPRLDLGLGCLYVGGALGTLLPGVHVPGGRSVLDVAGISGFTIAVTASDGSGPADCTRGAGPVRHCLNAQPGTDSHGACSSDADCADQVGACDADARCFFGAPIPVAMGRFSVCMVNAVARDVCGTFDLATDETTIAASLSSRVYRTGDPDAPCPSCVHGVCDGGERRGLPCAGDIDGTTVACPPSGGQFFARLDLNLDSLGTGPAARDHPDGSFCPGQRSPGAFGGEASAIRERGTPLLRRGLFDLALAGTFCVPATGNELFDTAADLPAPGAISVPGAIAIDLLP